MVQGYENVHILEPRKIKQQINIMLNLIDHIEEVLTDHSIVLAELSTNVFSTKISSVALVLIMCTHFLSSVRGEYNGLIWA